MIFITSNCWFQDMQSFMKPYLNIAYIILNLFNPPGLIWILTLSHNLRPHILIVHLIVESLITQLQLHQFLFQPLTQSGHLQNSILLHQVQLLNNLCPSLPPESRSPLCSWHCNCSAAYLSSSRTPYPIFNYISCTSLSPTHRAFTISLSSDRTCYLH